MYFLVDGKPISAEEFLQKLFDTLLNAEQREFVSYVLRNYVEVGVDELDVSKRSTVLTAKYGSIHAAQQQLGNVQDIQRNFIEFQSQLYKEAVG